MVAAEAETGKQLRFVDGVGIDRLYFDDQAAVNDYIHRVTDIELDSLITNRELLLTNEVNLGLSEFVAQAFLVGAFKQSRAEVAMHLDGNAYHWLVRSGLRRSSTGFWFFCMLV